MRCFGLAAAVVVSGLLALSACAAPPDAVGAPLDLTTDGGGNANATSTGSGSTPTCVPTSSTPPPQINVSSLPSCCTTGAAHCVPSADVPAGTEVSALASCTGGVCIPDSLIESGGAAPPACKSLNGAAGVCLSLCVPQVAQYSTLLPQDICQSEERCAPCISPLDGSNTGACDIGKNTGAAAGGGTTCTPAGGADDAGSAPSAPVDAGPPVCPHVGPPVLDPTSLPSCDPNGGAHCLSASLVPAAEASQLATCPTGLCVPDSFIESGGQFIPATCTSLLGAEGRCLDEMIPQVASQLSELPQATCETYERCVPCYDPISGKTTGACSLSCDPGPKDPAVKAQACCNENGTDQGVCLPTTSVPTSEQADLSADVCTQTPTATVCVPSEMAAPGFKPTTCTATSFLTLLSGGYSGVCLSKCLNFGFGSGLAIAQGTCDSDHDCAPCINPVTQAPTGAPGCPSTGADAGP
jgi:hypothetical protein